MSAARGWAGGQPLICVRAPECAGVVAGILDGPEPRVGSTGRSQQPVVLGAAVCGMLTRAPDRKQEWGVTYLTFKMGEIWMPDIAVFEAIDTVCATARACLQQPFRPV